MRKSCRAALCTVVAGVTAACSAASRPAVPVPAEPVSTEIAVATFDSLWSKVRSTYVDTAFVATEWVNVRDSLRPRALTITTRPQLDALLGDALHHIHDSHFYIIPARVAVNRSDNNGGGGKGTTGVEARVAEGKLVAWRVENGSPAWNAGVRPGEALISVRGKSSDSALKNVRSMPAQAQPLEFANMLHQFNGMLHPPAGDSVAIVTTKGPLSLIAAQSEGKLSQFGNLPPMAADVRVSRVATATGCAGIIAFNIWLPELGPDLEKAVDSVRSCEGIVIDLRGNPGGLGAMVMGFGGYFVDTTQSLGTMRSRFVKLNFVINPRASVYSGPLAILVDPMSASTSEIFAAGMQRIGRARVFGEPSAAAALPAMMERLPSGDVFVHAVADFTDPAGKRVEGVGVVPDETVPLTAADLAQGRDAPLDAAVRWIVSQKNRRTI
ncbi:MAG TPA: S41 family peptidase [Gemmatimonadaceae bacterium]